MTKLRLRKSNLSKSILLTQSLYVYQILKLLPHYTVQECLKVCQLMLHSLAKPAGILSILNVTQLTLSDEGYLCQGNFEDNPIQISIILHEYKLVNWPKSFFFLVEVNFHRKYRSLRYNKRHRSEAWWIVPLILNRFFGWLCCISHIQRWLSLAGPEKFDILHQMNVYSNHPRSFGKTSTYFVCSVHFYKDLWVPFYMQSIMLSLC